jgi:hypothetical protein
VSATPAVIVTSTPDGGLGKPVDFTLITQEDGVTSADRQAVSIGDPQQGGQRATVQSGGQLGGSLQVTRAIDEITIADRWSRREREEIHVAEEDVRSFTYVRRHADRVTTFDRRGSAGRGTTR